MSDARERIERLKRIERLRRRLHELAAWRLSAFAHERAKLAAAHVEMVEALGEGLIAYGPAAAAGARAVRKIERDLAMAVGVEQELAQRALDEARMAKLAENMLDDARAAHREILERKSLEELIEASLKPTGSRKP